VKGLRVEAIIRSGLRTFTDEAGHLWCALADYFLRQAQFEQARDVYEEGISSVLTVRDFSMLFDAYTQFEESMIAAQMEAASGADGGGSEAQQQDLEMRLARLERLMERRAELLSSVLLRQNPHSVHEWVKRAALFEGDPAKVIGTYATAVKTVDADKAVGKPQRLWLEFARFYEKHDDLRNARVILRKATGVPFKSVDDLAAVWMGWAEMEIRHKKYDLALSVLKEAVTIPPAAKRGKLAEEGAPVQARLYKHTRLWSFYADLQENLSPFEETRQTYEKMFELRIVTPQLVLNYAAFLEEHKHFEGAFSAFEKGVALFHHPHSLQIWLLYLTKFAERFGGTKLERARDLFEQALDGCPADESRKLFLLYAKLEEEHGLSRNAMAVYDRAVRTVTLAQRLELYNVYIAKAAEFFGVTKTRDIYEQAIAALPPAHVADMCIRYANLERKLGEVDRARAIYMHAAQDTAPAANPKFWATWHDFEVNHGNEDTFREMLRVKRSVEAQATGSSLIAGAKRPRDDEAPAAAEDSMAALDAAAPPPPPPLRPPPTGDAAGDFEAAPTFAGARPGFVFRMGDYGAGYYRDGGGAGAAAAGGGGEVEPEEIALGDDEPEIEQVKVPMAVFGMGSSENEPLGALDRFKKRSRPDE
jgi:pre-mRNA-splicing factor SYF1